MKIIVALYKYVFWGGLQKDTLRLAEEAVSRGHEVTVFTTAWDNPPDFINIEKVAAHGFTNVSRMRNFNNAWKERLARKDYDVSVAMDRVENADFYFAADSCLKAYYKRGYPNWLLSLMPRYRFILGMEEKVCGASSPTITWYISPFQREEYIAEYGTPEAHLQELPPGMNPACVRPEESIAAKIRGDIRTELGIGANDIVIVLVGTNIKRKGIDRLLAATGTLPENVRGKVKVVLVGNNDAASICSIAEKCGVRDNCMAVGARKDVDHILLASDLMVHPAREEGTGTVLVEGIASGIPVICSACCGFSGYVHDAAGLVTPEPFQQNELNAMLVNAIAKLPELTQKTREYAAQHDFTSRQRVMLDYIEQLKNRPQNTQNTQNTQK